MPLREALEEAISRLTAAGAANPKRDSEQLLLHILRRDRSFLLAHSEHQLTKEQFACFRQLVARRANSEPIQYILGEREFYGLRFAVTPDVLIPRPETEHLVEAALERIPLDAPHRIADVGTGSGAIAVAVAVNRPLAQLAAVDISPAALKIARGNAEAHHVADRIRFAEADLLDGFAAASFDMVVSNPPYIADGERESLDAEVRDYEPTGALFAGPTGLEVYERLIPQAARALLPGGWLLLEIGAGQHLQLSQLLKDWSQVGFLPDLQGIPRVMTARAPCR
jgi:release factor glutamine methyltransferase